MTTTKTIFDRSNLKGMAPELQDEIIRRFNDYDTMTRVLTTTSEALKTLVRTSPDMSNTDKQDIMYFAKLLRSATTSQWLKENNNYF